MLEPDKQSAGQLIFWPLLPSPDQGEELQVPADRTGKELPQSFCRRQSQQRMQLFATSSPPRTPFTSSQGALSFETLCLQTSLVYLKRTTCIKEMQIKIKIRYPYTSIRIAKNKPDNPKYWKSHTLLEGI